MSKKSKRCYVKVHRHGSETVLALCDEDLLGKTLTEGRIVLEVRKDFYGGVLIEIEEAVSLASSATVINAVGKNVLDMLTRINKFVYDAAVWIEGVPHVQIVR